MIQPMLQPRPQSRPQPNLWNRFTRGVPFAVRCLTLALGMGGLMGGIANFVFVPQGLWVWSMPPLAHRFLAAAAAAYVVGSIVTFTRRRWIESELLIATVALYGIPLVVAILMQTERINWATFIAWSFLAVVIPALGVTLWALWRNRTRAVTEPREPLQPALRLFLISLGLLAFGIGGWVYIAPKSAGAVWPWSALTAWDTLDSRLIASMLVTIGGAAALVVWRNDRGAAQVFLTMFCAYIIVGSAGILMHAALTPAFVVQDAVYVTVFGVLCLIGLILFPRRNTYRRA